MAEPMPVARFAAGPTVRSWAQKHGVSEWLAARLARLSDEPAKFLDGLLRRPPRYVRANPLRITAEELRKRLEAKHFSLSRQDLDENVFRVRDAPMSIGATLEHMQGMSTPQDLASASACVALAARPGDVVADLAAAPGVKTMHIAGDLALGPMTPRQEKGAIVAVEPDASRMRALRFNLERCGVAAAVLRRHNAQDLPGAEWADRVLLDAPCTGEGTMPKDRDRRRVDMREIQAMCAVQGELLETADRILKPGGTLVYATCTFAPEENEVQVMSLLRRGYRMVDTGFDRVNNVPLGRGVTEWPGHELDPDLSKARRFLPGIHPTLGFFVAKLQKPGHTDDAPVQPGSPRRAAAATNPRHGASPGSPPNRQAPPVAPAPSGPSSETGLRAATQKQETTVLRFFEDMEKHLSTGVMGRHQVAVRDQDGVPVAVATSNEVLALPAELIRDADAGGLVLGTLEGDRFHLDLQGAVLAARHSKAQTARVSEQATQLVLYGRNVLGTSILWHDRSLRQGHACIIADARGAALAIGVVTGSLSGSGPAIRPVLDLGTYLRDQDAEDDVEE